MDHFIRTSTSILDLIDLPEDNMVDHLVRGDEETVIEFIKLLSIPNEEDYGFVWADLAYLVGHTSRSNNRGCSFYMKHYTGMDDVYEEFYESLLRARCYQTTTTSADLVDVIDSMNDILDKVEKRRIKIKVVDSMANIYDFIAREH